MVSVGSDNYKTTFSYHADGGNTQIFYIWENNAWQRQDEVTFNSKGDYTASIEIDWYGVENKYEYEYTYNEQGVRTSSEKYKLEGNDRVLKGRLYFDSYGNDSMYYEYTDNNLAYQEECNYEYFTNTEGKLDSIVVSRSYDAGDPLEKDYKYEYSYNPDGKLIQEIEYQFNKSGNNWEKLYQYDYGYDTLGNMILIIEYEGWDEDNQFWFTMYKREITFIRTRSSFIGTRSSYIFHQKFHYLSKPAQSCAREVYLYR